VQTSSRRNWPRLVITLSPDARDALQNLASANQRDPKREATRLLLDAIEREMATQVAAGKTSR